jgi:hypothetical protein
VTYPMNPDNKSCNFLYDEVMSISVPYDSLLVRINKGIMAYADSGRKKFKKFFYPKKSVKEIEPLNLKPDEWVEVRSIDEISQTLDEKRKYKGLLFMPEMEKFCGKQFRVFKVVRVIKLESTGEVRKLKTPSIFLEGVYCDGERHEGCGRACFHFWKEAWLKKIPGK